jgi:hypothetical protein
MAGSESLPTVAPALEECLVAVILLAVPSVWW